MYFVFIPSPLFFTLKSVNVFSARISFICASTLAGILYSSLLYVNTSMLNSSGVPCLNVLRSSCTLSRCISGSSLMFFVCAGSYACAASLMLTIVFFTFCWLLGCEKHHYYLSFVNF